MSQKFEIRDRIWIAHRLSSTLTSPQSRMLNSAKPYFQNRKAKNKWSSIWSKGKRTFLFVTVSRQFFSSYIKLYSPLEYLQS